MSNKIFWRLSALLVTLASVGAVAQNTNGTILGTVVDTTKAAVGNASIIAVNSGTQASSRATARGDGSFSVLVSPGNYDVTIEAPGFKTFKVSHVHVEVNTDSRIDAVLGVGEASQVITVDAINNNVDTTSATLKSVVGEQTIQEMPLNGRNPISLVLLVPGVTRDPKANVTSGATYPGASGVSINGTRSDETNYILDGASNNDNYTNAPNPFPDPDALREFSVQTNNFSAEFGRLAGGVINVVTKYGTNQLHGSAFEYVRNNDFNAANHFAAVTNGHKSDDGLKRNQFGGTLGGPIFVPKIYNGKDRSFFFVSYQGTIVHQRPNATGAVVPDAKLRNGDFSELSTPLYVPYDQGRSTFAGNQIPDSAISPVAKALLAYIPTAGAGTATNSQGGQQVFFSSFNNTNDNQELVRIDQHIKANNTLYGSFWNSQQSSPAFLNSSNYLAYKNAGRWISRRYMASDTQIFSPNMLNQALFSYSHNQYKNTPIYPAQTLPSLGVNLYVPPGSTEYQFSVSSYFNLYTGDTNEFIRDEYQGIDTVRLTLGNHQLAFGGEYDHGTGDNINNYQQNPIYTFSQSSYTPNPQTVATSTGNSFADFLLGRFNAFTQGAGEYKNTRFNHVAAFIDDTWKVNSRLVLDTGARYEPFLPYTDLNNKLAVWRPGEQSALYPNAPSGVLFVGDPGIPKGGFNTAWKNIGPRMGFAYDVAGAGKTSIRGGFGMFFDQPNTITTNNQTDQAPFAPVIHLNGTSATNIQNPYAGSTNPFPYPTPPTSSATFPAYTSQYLYSAHMRNGYVEAWNLQLQQDLGWGSIFSVTYAGSMGVHLPVARELNAAVYTPGSSTTANTNQRRPFAPALGSTTLLDASSSSNYHALQFNLERHFNKGLSLAANYTWSKAMDTSSDTKTLGQTVTIPTNPHFDYGPADYDRRHVINVSSIWAIPGPKRNLLLQELLGGWQSTMIANYTGGYPFSIYSGQDNALTGLGHQRGDLVSGQIATLGRRSTAASSAHWFNPAAFIPNAIGTYGDTGRNAYRGPGYTDVDLGLLKSFRLREKLNTTFRFEAFNVFNHTNLQPPDNTVTDGNFSRITAAYDPRILQGALRFDW
jgi:outer membrane receptor protein involved in Fe transport